MHIKAMDLDSPMMQGFDIMKNLFILNIYTIMCCIPVVTAGAALTAMHYTALRIVRDEESYITKNYFQAFKANLKQGIGVTLLMLLVTAVVVADIYAISLFGGEIPWFVTLAKVLLAVIGVVVSLTMTFYFPVAAKFEAKVSQNLANAFKLSLAKFPRTLLMIALNIIPWALIYFFPVLSPLMLVFGISGPAFFNAEVYDKVFKKMEKAYAEANPVEEDDVMAIETESENE